MRKGESGVSLECVRTALAASPPDNLYMQSGWRIRYQSHYSKKRIEGIVQRDYNVILSHLHQMYVLSYCTLLQYHSISIHSSGYVLKEQYSLKHTINVPSMDFFIRSSKYWQDAGIAIGIGSAACLCAWRMSASDSSLQHSRSGMIGHQQSQTSVRAAAEKHSGTPQRQGSS